MNAAYTVLFTIPEDFDGANVNMANQGLYALERVLAKALATQGYAFQMAAGRTEIVMSITKERGT